MNNLLEYLCKKKSNAGLESTQGKSKSILFKVATWAITCFCFYLVLSKTQTTAAREGLTLVEYLVRFLETRTG